MEQMAVLARTVGLVLSLCASLLAVGCPFHQVPARYPERWAPVQADDQHVREIIAAFNGAEEVGPSADS